MKYRKPKKSTTAKNFNKMWKKLDDSKTEKNVKQAMDKDI